MTRIRVGVVEGYDAIRGMGAVLSDRDRYLFHCTAMADGTRQIDPGVRVAFLVVAGLGGELEARSLSRF